MEPDRSIHSIHGYFLRPADVGVPIRYDVERVRDGRGYSNRAVVGYQYDKAVFSAQASFQVEEEGEDFGSASPADVPDPESLPSAAEALSGIDSAAAHYWSHGRSFDMRHVPSPIYVDVADERVPSQGVWVRAFDALPDDAALQRTALAYVCDYTILEPILRAHGYAWSDPRLTTASLDHAMWFHRDGSLNDWVLYAQEGLSARSNRGLTLGRFFDHSGRHLATVAQEGMVRWRPDDTQS
ncbi:acyl-CoA thioesterase [Microbacterium sp. NIBRBAC000506063]|uniref:acyl-CoA thioesterase n=1 Tax=Microbacterium sp. NIBRBAC000506063 TaxID=2734618 RepID=UPI0021D41106|nr:acyl-CoA thioesterase domain-containing protein [Microbacterium sp. NIBRBAC000506063]